VYPSSLAHRIRSQPCKEDRHHPLLLRNRISQYLLARLCNARHLSTKRALGDVSCQIFPFRAVLRRKYSSRPFANGTPSIAQEGGQDSSANLPPIAPGTGVQVFASNAWLRSRHTLSKAKIINTPTHATLFTPPLPPFGVAQCHPFRSPLCSSYSWTFIGPINRCGTTCIPRNLDRQPCCTKTPFWKCGEVWRSYLYFWIVRGGYKSGYVCLSWPSLSRTAREHLSRSAWHTSPFHPYFLFPNLVMRVEFQ
jgi:hypothetical protein